MDTNGLPANQLDVRAKTAWRLQIAAGLAFFALLLVVYTVAMVVLSTPVLVWVLPVLGFVALTAVWLGPAVEIMYRRWRWEVTDTEVRLQSGLIIIKRTVIPMARIQHVDTSQGPILRLFDLSEVHVSTAAGPHKIPMLAETDAAAIRDRIAALAQVTDDGGL